MDFAPYMHFYIPNGEYDKNVNIPIGTRDRGLYCETNTIPCSQYPTHYINGVWVCSDHTEPECDLPLFPKNNVCAICLDICHDMYNSCITTCNHIFHKKCILDMIHHQMPFNCPMCRTPFSIHNLPMAPMDEMFQLINELQINDLLVGIFGTHTDSMSFSNDEDLLEAINDYQAYHINNVIYDD